MNSKLLINLTIALLLSTFTLQGCKTLTGLFETKYSEKYVEEQLSLGKSVPVSFIATYVNALTHSDRSSWSADSNYNVTFNWSRGNSHDSRIRKAKQSCELEAITSAVTCWVTAMEYAGDARAQIVHLLIYGKNQSNYIGPDIPGSNVRSYVRNTLADEPMFPGIVPVKDPRKAILYAKRADRYYRDFCSWYKRNSDAYREVHFRSNMGILRFCDYDQSLEEIIKKRVAHKIANWQNMTIALPYRYEHYQELGVAVASHNHKSKQEQRRYEQQ